jgi:hypothetical protein
MMLDLGEVNSWIRDRNDIMSWMHYSYICSIPTGKVQVWHVELHKDLVEEL